MRQILTYYLCWIQLIWKNIDYFSCINWVTGNGLTTTTSTNFVKLPYGDNYWFIYTSMEFVLDRTCSLVSWYLLLLKLIWYHYLTMMILNKDDPFSMETDTERQQNKYKRPWWTRFHYDITTRKYGFFLINIPHSLHFFSVRKSRPYNFTKQGAHLFFYLVNKLEAVFAFNTTVGRTLACVLSFNTREFRWNQCSLWHNW